MGSFLNQPILQPIDNSQKNFRVMSEFLFYFKIGEFPDELPAVNYGTYKGNPCIVVPRGFVTDMASIPRPLWSLYSPFGKHGNASILHDWLYSTEMFSRSACDEIFHYAMKVSGVGILDRNIIYYHVRAYGGFFVWNRHDKLKVQVLRQLANEANSTALS